jgi:hypothetical protein
MSAPGARAKPHTASRSRCRRRWGRQALCALAWTAENGVTDACAHAALASSRALAALLRVGSRTQHDAGAAVTRRAASSAAKQLAPLLRHASRARHAAAAAALSAAACAPGGSRLHTAALLAPAVATALGGGGGGCGDGG